MIESCHKRRSLAWQAGARSVSQPSAPTVRAAADDKLVIALNRRGAKTFGGGFEAPSDFASCSCGRQSSLRGTSLTPACAQERVANAVLHRVPPNPAPRG